MAKKKIEISNRRASFNYILMDKFVAGLVLAGTEIKSIREGKAAISDAYCTFIGNELWVNNMHIAEYRLGTYYNHAALRQRKLLLTRRELKKLQNKTKETGLTIVPTLLFISDKGYAKLEIYLAKGKKSYDKRESIKEKDDKRELDRAMKR